MKHFISFSISILISSLAFSAQTSEQTIVMTPGDQVVVVSKITDSYKKNKKGKFELKDSQFLVGSFADVDGQGPAVLTESKVIKGKEAEAIKAEQRLGEVLKMAEGMTKRQLANAKTTVSETSCETKKNEKYCTTSIEMVSR